MTLQQDVHKFTNVFNYASTSNKNWSDGIEVEEDKNLIDLYIEAKLKQCELNMSGNRPLLKKLFLRNQIAMLTVIGEVINLSVQQSSTLKENPGKPTFLGPLLAELESQESKKSAAVSSSNLVPVDHSFHAESVKPVIRSSSRRKAAHPQKCIQQKEDIETEAKSRKRPCSQISNEDQNSPKQTKT